MDRNIFQNKTHRLIARKQFTKNDGTIVKQGDVFETKLHSFVKDAREYFLLHLDGMLQQVPCSHVAFYEGEE